jgi:cysteine-rich repeat protein
MVLLAVFASDVHALRAASCRRECDGVIRACIEEGRRPRRCRRAVVRRCRRQGTAFCLATPSTTTTVTLPSTTTTSLPLAPVTSTTLPIGGPRCGDGRRDANEVCDGTDFGDDRCGAAPQESGGGVLRCAPDCLGVDRRGCFRCGNGVKDGVSETCDGDDFGGLGCGSYGYREDERHGLLCATACDEIITADCLFCGNGRVEADEECDGGPGNGQPDHACAADCTSRCGDGVRQRGEQCDDGNRLPDDGCSPSCLVEALVGGGLAGDSAATPAIDRCYAAWAVGGTGRPAGTDVTCDDGERCDADPAPGRCLVGYYVCFNVPQAGPGACTPSATGITRVTASDANLLTAVAALLGGTVDGSGVTVPPVADETCTHAALAVTTEASVTLVVETTDGVVVDHDELRFTCAP